MAEKFDRYECLRDALYRFACGPWPPIAQEFKWRSRDEVAQALRWITQLEREQEREEEEERRERDYRRSKPKKKAADVVKLVRESGEHQ